MEEVSRHIMKFTLLGCSKGYCRAAMRLLILFKYILMFDMKHVTRTEAIVDSAMQSFLPGKRKFDIKLHAS